MPVAAVVVTHRGGAILDACLASIRAQTRAVDELLVVVSNTTLRVDAPALQLGANVGYARAANAGARAVRGDVLLLNDDTRLAPECVARLADHPEERAVWQPRIVLADGSGRLDNLGHGFFFDGAVWARGRNGPAGARLGEPGGFSGAAVLLPRFVWDELGGFDERMGSFGEDVDLSLRLMRRGIPVRAVPDAVVEHHLGASWGRSPPEKLRAIERNRIRAAVRSMPLAAVLTLPAWTGARLALYQALRAAGRGPAADVPPAARDAAVRGLVEGLGDVPTWWADRRDERGGWTRGELAMWAALWRGRARWEDVWR